MNTTLENVSFPDHRRILIISDIHGHADGLRSILEKARFGASDILIILGDLIEKGFQSLDTLRLVMALKKQYAVYVLMGNVELWRLEFLLSEDPEKWREFKESALWAVDWWGCCLLGEMCDEIGAPLTPETDMVPLIPLIRERFSDEISFMAQMPTILDSQRMTFVHGGIPHERLKELVGTDNYPLLKFDDFYSAGLSFQKYVVVGHWPAVLYSKTYPVFSPLIDRQRRIISLDGACGVKHEGQLNLLILEDWRSDEFSLVTWDALPTLTALDVQAPSPEEDAVYIRWNDHAIELIEKGAEMSKVRYHGRIVPVPTQFIFDHNGVLSCSDITDYRIETKPGDQLRLILKLSDGCYVKKDNAAGWYFGRYKMNEVKDK